MDRRYTDRRNDGQNTNGKNFNGRNNIGKNLDSRGGDGQNTDSRSNNGQHSNGQNTVSRSSSQSTDGHGTQSQNRKHQNRTPRFSFRAFWARAAASRRVRRELAVLGGLLLALALCNFTGFAATCDAVRDDTLRLHILANSDSEADQALKLAVRDAILAQAGELFSAGQTKQEALAAARRSLPALQAIAQQTLRAHGCADTVAVRLENQYFATRAYDDFTLPAGRYDAVRVEIGAHAGKNWFCVLFPPLCLPAACEEDAPTYPQAEWDAVQSPYRLRFAAVEVWESWKEAVRQSAEAS